MTEADGRRSEQCESEHPMEIPLSPFEFARRARKLHGAREAVVDCGLRLTCSQFGERCDRWSAALAKLRVRQGDRVGTISPNTHQHLEQFYAIPQLGAAIVPMNYRLAVYTAKVHCTEGERNAVLSDARCR
jgi:acyl-CoA synthetase (AMP-forming)/AMP-acid ligase II